MMHDMTPDTTYDLNHALKVVENGPAHPEFDTAWEYLAMSNHATIREAMRLAMEETFGPYPLPTGYNHAGEPYWDVGVMSQYLGIPQDQLEDTVSDIQEKWGPQAGILETSALNRVH